MVLVNKKPDIMSTRKTKTKTKKPYGFTAGPSNSAGERSEYGSQRSEKLVTKPNKTKKVLKSLNNSVGNKPLANGTQVPVSYSGVDSRTKEVIKPGRLKTVENTFVVGNGPSGGSLKKKVVATGSGGNYRVKSKTVTKAPRGKTIRTKTKY